MVYFDSEAIYIQSKQTLQDKIAAIDAIIEALELEALNMAGKASIQEYSINNGQTIIKTIYRGAVGIASALKDFETIRERYVQKLNGRHVRLMDQRNFTDNRKF